MIGGVEDERRRNYTQGHNRSRGEEKEEKDERGGLNPKP
jgi:hypothetical protein